MMKCKTCGAVLMFSSKPEICGPCDRKARGVATVADFARDPRWVSKN